MKRYLVSSFLLRKSFYTYLLNIARRLNTLVSLISTDLFRSSKKAWQEPSDSPYKNVIVAKGIYNDGKRVGTWVFTSDIPGVIDSYNYDENIVLIDLTSERNMENAVAYGINRSWSLVNRVKIGGFLCSIPPPIFRPELPVAIHERFPDGWELDCSHTFILGLTGAIIKHEILVKYENIEKGYVWDKGMPDTEFKRFIPACYN
ncbi:hypothetical protein [Mucilaginibacter sp. L196]|uniref:hypothetical protein n=1 Tax=Mucilaginibacter sp. L196 TaxID=1641870 RepID=UPI00131D8F06|nr:hypothetical protein [Mucilaginibacter sp. L196]